MFTLGMIIITTSVENNETGARLTVCEKLKYSCTGFVFGSLTSPHLVPQIDRQRGEETECSMTMSFVNSKWKDLIFSSPPRVGFTSDPNNLPHRTLQKRECAGWLGGWLGGRRGGS